MAMARKEVLHVQRDPTMTWLAIGMPVLLVLIFGFGVRFDLDRLPVAWVDLDVTRGSDALREELLVSGELVLAQVCPDVACAERSLRSNRSVAAFVVPAGAAADQERGEPVVLQLLVDGTDGTVANAALADAEALATAASISADHRPPRSLVKTVIRYNPRGESAMFLLPGTIAYVLALVSVLLTALAIAREWERGSMEQLFSTTVGGLEIVIGKLLPYLLLGMFDVLLVLAVGASVFALPFRGSLPLVGVASILFLVGMLGQGLLVSILTRSQMLATQLGAVSAVLPSLLLSGFLFPVENLPAPLYALSMVVPARFHVGLLRGALLKGSGWSDHWLDLLGLFAYATLTVVASAAAFRRRVA
jgi:ABC-2 type transport system permease protein